MVVSLYFGGKSHMFQMVAKWRSFKEPCSSTRAYGFLVFFPHLRGVLPPSETFEAIQTNRSMARWLGLTLERPKSAFRQRRSVPPAQSAQKKKKKKQPQKREKTRGRKTTQDQHGHTAPTLWGRARPFLGSPSFTLSPTGFRSTRVTPTPLLDHVVSKLAGFPFV